MWQRLSSVDSTPVAGDDAAGIPSDQPEVSSQSLAPPPSASHLAPQTSAASTSTVGSDHSPQSTESSTSGVAQQVVMSPSPAIMAAGGMPQTTNPKEMLEGFKSTLEAARLSQNQAPNNQGAITPMSTESKAAARPEQTVLEPATQGDETNRKRDDRFASQNS